MAKRISSTTFGGFFKFLLCLTEQYWKKWPSNTFYKHLNIRCLHYLRHLGRVKTRCLNHLIFPYTLTLLCQKMRCLRFLKYDLYRDIAVITPMRLSFFFFLMKKIEKQIQIFGPRIRILNVGSFLLHPLTCTYLLISRE